MSPIDNPEYREQADKIIEGAQQIKKAVEENGFGTAATLQILSVLMGMTQVAGSFMQLPKDQRDEFFAEVFDAAIGEEPNALVKKVAIFEGEALEKMSDAIKAGALAYFNRNMPETV